MILTRTFGLHHHMSFDDTTTVEVPGFDPANGTLLNVKVSWADIEMAFDGTVKNTSADSATFAYTDVVGRLVVSCSAGVLDTLAQDFTDQTSGAIAAGATWALTLETLTPATGNGSATITDRAILAALTTRGTVPIRVTRQLSAPLAPDPVTATFVDNIESLSQIGGGTVSIIYTFQAQVGPQFLG